MWRILAMLLVIGMAGPAAAAAGSKADAGLMLRGQGDGPPRPAPLLSTAVDIRVAGVVARTRVTQHFLNPGEDWVEGVYVFPLPDDSAVDTLRMRVGERVIEGRIQERRQARRSYERARRDGRRASLVEQERPNVFTASVANIAPGQRVTVEIEYQQTVPFRDGRYSLRFPTVVAPRYIPGDAAGPGTATGWAAPTDQVPDAHRITPPVRGPGEGAGNPFTLQAMIDAGMPLAEARSLNHPMDVRFLDDGRVRLAMPEGGAPADRDVVLEWWPEVADLPRVALFRERREGSDYLLAVVQPPEIERAEVPPRDVVFVLDVSGSMAGDSIDQAKKALRLAIDSLRPRDRFNVIAFNHQAWRLWDAPRPATPVAGGEAKGFLGGLRADGGTEILSAVRLALANPPEPERLRQIVFLTDGSVGNEGAIFREIRSDIGEARLFTVGIGSAPNTHFMRKAAQAGRGSYTFIGAAEDVVEGMVHLFHKLESPALTDLRLDLPEGMQAAVLPSPLPDLYAGEPVVFALKAPEAKGVLRLSGRRGEEDWREALDVSAARPADGVAKDWGRRKIAAIEDGRMEGVDAETVRARALAVALEHGLVSRYTSLVAVDVTPVRPHGEGVDSRAVPTNLPAGMVHAKVFGARTATPATLHLMAGVAALALAALLALVARRRRRCAA